MRRLERADATLSISKWMRSLWSANASDRPSPFPTLTNSILGLTAAGAIYISITSEPGALGILGASLALVMLAIAVIDWRSFIIPDALNAAGAILGIIYAIAQKPDAMLQTAALAASRGGLIALIFFALRYSYARLRGRQGLGLGDVKLAFVAGVWLDWLLIPIAIQMAAFAALSAYLLRQFISGQSISAANRMPFGLFFAPAIWVCWVLQVRWLDGF